MKKAVPLIILGIFIMSIAIVGFFGMKIMFAEESVYVKEIHFTNQGIMEEEDGRKVLYLLYEPVNGYYEYQLTWEVLDVDATNKNVRFIYDTTQEGVEIICNENVNGLVRFSKLMSITIQIVPDDGGGGKGDKISIILY